ncbi:MAG: hypothetical protein ACBR12_23790, partial [Microcoleus sp.]
NARDGSATEIIEYFYSRFVSDDSLLPPHSVYVPVGGAECGFKSEAEPLDIGSLAEPGNQLRASGYSTRYQALPGNADPEALPPFLLF